LSISHAVWTADERTAMFSIYINSSANEVARQLQITRRPILCWLTRKWPFFDDALANLYWPMISTKRSTNQSAAFPMSCCRLYDQEKSEKCRPTEKLADLAWHSNEPRLPVCYRLNVAWCMTTHSICPHLANVTAGWMTS